MTEAVIQFTCSQCGTVYQVNSTQLGDHGKIARCVVCNHRFAVRYVTEPAEAAPPESVPSETVAAEPYPEAPLFVEMTEDAGEVEEVEATEIRLGEAAVSEVDMPEEVVIGDIDKPEEAAATDTQRRARSPLQDVEMPDQVASPVGVTLDGDRDESTETRRRWRDPMRAEKKRGAIFGISGDAAQPSSGVLYKTIIIVVGLLGFSTSLLNIGAWQFDPIWSLTLVALGIAAFWMQSLSGLLVAGLFCFFYPLSLFSGQVQAIAAGEFTGVILIAAQTAFAAIILIVYGILMARKGALFVLKEGSVQSIVAIVFAALTLLLFVWAHLESSVLPMMNNLSLGGATLGSTTYYAQTPEYGMPVTVLILASVLSLSIAFGFSARAVRNRLLMLANVSLALGFIALLLLYAPLVIGKIRIPLF
ncbi:MAG TPA: zinc-ribbon domain-containing protein [Acidobacteriota bacterium]|nr:zinc-ribbon domain-containing protein [Acidobacteriota bacterium]